MDFNQYAVEQLVRDRLEALREAAARRRRLGDRPTISTRERAGRVLMRLGAWLVATGTQPPVTTVTS